MPDFASLTLDIADGIAAIRLAQPDRGNPFDVQLCSELSLAANECDENPGVRAVLIEADGRFFSVGGDLAALGASREELPRFIKHATVPFHAAVSRFARMDAPVVTAVHALAAGGGVSLLAGADIVVASRDAKFYAAYQGIGLGIDGGGTHHLPRRVGLGRARSFYLRNQTWTAEQAHEYGLVDVLADDAPAGETARAIAAELAAGPTKAFGVVKNLLADTLDTPLEAQLEAEARSMAATGRSDDAWAAITAVAAKQRPAFRGA